MLPMRILALAGVVVLLTGCMRIYRHAKGVADPDIAEVQVAAAPVLECDVAYVVARDDGAHSDEGYRWSAEGCSNGVACKQTERGWACLRLPLPAWIGAWAGHSKYKHGEDGFEGIASSVAAQTGCESEPEVVELASRERGGTATFGANLCDRQFECVSRVDMRRNVTNDTTCTELAASADRTARRVSVNRLALETGCPENNIQVATTAAWVNGTERAYRLMACGHPYVCTTATGRSDCKAALAQVEPPESPPPPPPPPASTTGL